MVDFRYHDEGVRIGGAWYPIVKMRWIEGQSLNRFVAQSLGQGQLLDLLLDLWIKLAARLRASHIAHADLQHGNVVLVPEASGKRLLLKLIDYDGMYVPALSGQGSGEVGHANYQHPQRAATGAFHADLDRFSHLVICTALRCLRVGGLPLWERFNTGENLLFTAADFAEPGESKLFRELWTLRGRRAHALVGHLLLATKRPLEEAPPLETIFRGEKIRSLTDDERDRIQLILQGEIPAAPHRNRPSRISMSEIAAIIDGIESGEASPIAMPDDGKGIETRPFIEGGTKSTARYADRLTAATSQASQKIPLSSSAEVNGATTRYEITGIDGKGGHERVMIVEAPNERESLAIAKKNGIFATNVRILPVEPPPAPLPNPLAVLPDKSAKGEPNPFAILVVGLMAALLFGCCLQCNGCHVFAIEALNQSQSDDGR